MTDTANELIAWGLKWAEASGDDRFLTLVNALEAAEALKDDATTLWDDANKRAVAAEAEVGTLQGANGALEAENARLLALAQNVTTAFTAESEDWNDGEYTLWRKDDLIAALVALRVAVPPASAALGGERADKTE